MTGNEERAVIEAAREVAMSGSEALAEAARWFIERADEWLHDQAEQSFDPRHITHAAALFEKALTATPDQEGGEG